MPKDKKQKEELIKKIKKKDLELSVLEIALREIKKLKEKKFVQKDQNKAKELEKILSNLK